MLTFPADIGTHSTVLMFKDYVYTGGGVHSEFTSGGDIILPLPKTLQDSLNVKVGGDELGVVGSMAAEVGGASFNDFGSIKTMFSQGTDDANNLAATNTISEAASIASDSALFIAKAGLGGAFPDIEKGLGAGSGTAINPYATLVFSGVDLKVHTFEWLLSPSSLAESITLKEIIRTIQENIVPEVEGVAITAGNGTLSRGLLRYPSMVDVRFTGVDFYKIKTSMISAFSVDYAPEGIAIYKQGKPAVVRITMTMTEAQIHTKADYKASSAPNSPGSDQTLQEIVVDVARRPGFTSTGEEIG
jgi:hypothetical protein